VHSSVYEFIILNSLKTTTRPVSILSYSMANLHLSLLKTGDNLSTPSVIDLISIFPS